MKSHGANVQMDLSGLKWPIQDPTWLQLEQNSSEVPISCGRDCLKSFCARGQCNELNLNGFVFKVRLSLSTCWMKDWHKRLIKGSQWWWCGGQSVCLWSERAHCHFCSTLHGHRNRTFSLILPSFITCLVLPRSSLTPLPYSLLNLKASCKYYLLASPTFFPFNMFYHVHTSPVWMNFPVRACCAYKKSVLLPIYQANSREGPWTRSF